MCPQTRLTFFRWTTAALLSKVVGPEITQLEYEKHLNKKKISLGNRRALHTVKIRLIDCKKFENSWRFSPPMSQALQCCIRKETNLLQWELFAFLPGMLCQPCIWGEKWYRATRHSGYYGYQALIATTASRSSGYQGYHGYHRQAKKAIRTITAIMTAGGRGYHGYRG